MKSNLAMNIIDDLNMSKICKRYGKFTKSRDMKAYVNIFIGRGSIICSYQTFMRLFE